MISLDRFYPTLVERNLLGLITSAPFSILEFQKTVEVRNFLLNVIQENKKVLLVPDPDPDGAFARMIASRSFDQIGFTNYEYYKYNSRSHKIDIGCLFYAIENKFEAVIIFDQGSQEPNVTSRMKAMGMDVLIIDHHRSAYEYSDFDCEIINTSIENRTAQIKTKLSAGGVSYMVFLDLLKHLNINEPVDLAPMALCSLYADSMDMSDPVNRSIYAKAMNVPRVSLPHIVHHFMSDNQGFTKRFITFALNPRLNALFRIEDFNRINNLLSWKPNHGPIEEKVQEIIDIHGKISHEMDRVVDFIDNQVTRSFVVANMSSVINKVGIRRDLLPNFTGVVGNKLVSKYSKVAVVLADTGHDIKGSLRDTLGRDYLSLFKRFCKADGHNSAFGINIPYKELNTFLSYVNLLDSQVETIQIDNSPIIVHIGTAENINKDIVDHMATYNEFCGSTAPVALLQKVVTDVSNYNMSYNKYVYKFGKFKIKSDSRLIPGAKILLCPTKSYNRHIGAVTDLHVVSRK